MLPYLFSFVFYLLVFFFIQVVIAQTVLIIKDGIKYNYLELYNILVLIICCIALFICNIKIFALSCINLSVAIG